MINGVNKGDNAERPPGRTSPAGREAFAKHMSIGKLRYSFIATLFMAAVFADTASMAADNTAQYPSRPITFVVPTSPGGPTDLAARLVAKHLSTAWKVPVVVENRSGAGGAIGWGHVIHSKPDGYTVLIAPSALGVRSGLDHKLPFNAVHDLAGVGLLGLMPSYLLLPSKLGITSIAQLTAYAKAQKGGVNYGSPGVGSTSNLHSAIFAHNHGFKATNIAYRGTSEALNDVVAGRLTFAILTNTSVLHLAHEGKIRVLAATSERGVSLAKGLVPNPIAVLTGDIGDDWEAAFVPAGTPDEIRSKLSKEIARIIATPEARESFAVVGAQAKSSTPEELDTMFRKYVAQAHSMGDAIGITLN